MKADVTLQALYFNKGVAQYFFREQAYREFEKLVKTVMDITGDFDELESRIEEMYSDVDEFEEDCYSLQLDELLYNLGYVE